jgi:hypothetical protein
MAFRNASKSVSQVSSYGSESSLGIRKQPEKSVLDLSESSRGSSIVSALIFLILGHLR